MSGTDLLGGLDIGKVMSSSGPIVKCVILRTHPVKGNAASVVDPDRDISTMSISEIKRELESYDMDTASFVEKNELVKALEEAREANLTKKPAAKEPMTNGDVPQDGQSGDQDETNEPTKTKVVPLTHLIEEIEVDTTPKKSMVSKVLGGEFTFIGQYEEEGIMVMVRRPDWEREGSSFDEADIPPINPHELQPPLDDVEVRGDILLMRVAETDEVLDSDEEEEDNEKGEDEEVDNGEDQTGAEKFSGEEDSSQKSSSEPAQKAPEKAVVVPENDEFFLDYTRDEYLKFAARTDIVAKPIEESDEEEESEDESGDEQGPMPETQVNAEEKLKNSEEEEDDDEHDEEFDPDEIEEEEEDFDSEEHQVGMMNLILGQILRKFHEENGRGPDTLELLEMRKALADRLGVEVPPVDEDACDWDKKVATPKRHNKKVKVVEEKNESETIPRACEEQHDDEVEEEETSEVLKRPASALEKEDATDTDDQQHRNKKAKVEEENGNDEKVDS